MNSISAIREHLFEGQVIPALPLALSRNRRWSERSQRAVMRYYMDAGAGGIAVGVHSTQFEIRDPEHALFEPLLKFAVETIEQWDNKRPFLRVAGVCGKTEQATREANFAKDVGYHAALLSMTAFNDETEAAILQHCKKIARILPIIGFYMQTAVGGRRFSYAFWRKFAEIENVVAIKIAPFNRYQTFDVVRAVIESGREDIALYTGNDDNIIGDLTTPYEYAGKQVWIRGGLLGQWGVWTQRAVAMLQEIKKARKKQKLDFSWNTKNADLTDANGILFDAANGFAGCIPGIHEILRRQGIFESIACLNPEEKLSRGQAAELDRVCAAYPWLLDDDFVAANLERWLS